MFPSCRIIIGLLILVSIIILLISVLNLFIVHAIYEQDVYGSATCLDISKMISEVKNCNSYFHYTTLFSDLSRNMTSSSDLFEDNGTDTQLQDNIESDTEVNGFQEGDAPDTDQTSPPPSSPSASDLFEDSSVNTQLQDNIESNNTDIDQQDETIAESLVDNDNNNNATTIP
jgi:hypothetical protein